MTDVRSTRRWKKLRASYAARLPTNCWRCGGIIWETDDWELGHLLDQVDGGSELAVAPEHRTCNRRAAGRTQGWRGQASMRAARVIAGEQIRRQPAWDRKW